ncbi:MAG: SBBP repeat-containing protein [Bryobacteraceae bacterium]|nr:SBBP repeat-containing protein [Bryobacteraceae bacterium]
MTRIHAPRRVWQWLIAASLLLAGPVLGKPPSLPLQFLPAPASAPGCSWLARGFDYSVCIAPDRIRLHHAGRILSWSYPGRSGPLRVEPASPPLSSVNEFRGADPAFWRSGIPAFGTLRIPDLYPGIDLVLSGADGRLKIDYIVAPGADPASIRLRFHDISGIRVGPHGGLLLDTQDGEWREDAPVFYQPGPRPVPVTGRVVVYSDGSAGFAPGPYDPALPLVIDPILSFSTLLGGTGSNSPQSMAVGPSGEIVVAGFTDSPTFPAVNPQRNFAAGVEAVIVKLAPGGASVLQTTFLGGAGDDRAFAVAIDPDGGIYVAGWTTSSNFPTVNPWRSARSGYRDAFLARLAPSGDHLTFSTFLGGAGEEQARALTASNVGVWVAGETNSADFPLVSALQTTLNGPQNGFVAHFLTSGSPVWSTYLGGNGTDTLRSLTLAPSGELYVAGGSTSTNLPVPPLAWQSQPGGGQDGFILRINPSGSAVTGGTWLGGSAGGPGSAELVQSIALTPAAQVIAGGSTPSPDFPTLSPWSAIHRGASMGFLARLRADLTGAVWSTFAGGMNTDHIEGVAVDTAGRVFAAGRTFSLDLPLATPLQATYQGNGDAFLLVLSPDGGTQVFGTYLGGQDSDSAIGVSLTPDGDAVVAGISSSLDFPVAQPLASPSQPAPRFFISLIDMAFHAPVPVSVTPAAAQGQEQIFDFIIRDADGSEDVRSVLVLIHSSFTSSGACYISAEPGPNLLSLASDSGLQWSAATAGSATILSNSQCRLRAAGSALSLVEGELRLRLDLAFEPSFAGVRQIQVLGADARQLSSGWITLGNYTVLTGAGGAPPVAAMIHPPSGSGLRQIFTLTVTDPQGAQDVKEARILAAPALSTSQACLVRFTTSPSQIHLANDAGTSWASATPGSGSTLQNSQCRVHAASSGHSTGASAALFWADLEFLPSWTGTRLLWGAAIDTSHLETAWTELGSFEASSSTNQAPVVESVSTPGTGGGFFQFTASDPNGGAGIRHLHLLIGDAPAGSGCLIHFDAVLNRASLHPGEDGAAWPSVTPGQTGLAENPLCRLRGEGTMVSITGNQARFQLQIEFKSGFSGQKLLKVHVLDSAGAISPQFRTLGVVQTP